MNVVMMKVSEAGAVLNVCTETVRRYIARGQIAAFKLPGKHGEWRIPSTEIARLLAKCDPRESG